MPLVPADFALLLIDIQPGIAEFSRTSSSASVIRAASTAAVIAKLLDIPAFVSVVPTSADAPKPVAELETLPTYARHLFGSLDQPEIRDAIAATGRKAIAIGGIASEVAVLQGALSAIRAGYTVHILTDCCGGLTARTEAAAFRQLETAGATLSSVASLFTTLQPDFANPQTGQMLGLLMGLISNP